MQKPTTFDVKATVFIFGICQVLLPSRLAGSGLPEYELALFLGFSLLFAFLVGIMVKWVERQKARPVMMLEKS